MARCYTTMSNEFSCDLLFVNESGAYQLKLTRLSRISWCSMVSNGATEETWPKSSKKDFEIDAIACPARTGNPARDQTYANMLQMFNNVQYS